LKERLVVVEKECQAKAELALWDMWHEDLLLGVALK
jgi:hypothetical protein